jgi:hypothetical protein
MMWQKLREIDWKLFERRMSNVHFLYGVCAVFCSLVVLPLRLFESGPTFELFFAVGFFFLLGVSFIRIGCRTVAEQMQNDASKSTIEGEGQ